MPGRTDHGTAGGEGSMSTFNGRRRTGAGMTIDILPPEAARSKVIRFRRPGDVVDAHFVPVGDIARRSEATRSHDETRFAARAGSVGRSGILARLAEAIERKLLRLSPDSFLALVAAACVAVFTLFGGLSLISDNGQAEDAGPALDITHVTMTPQDANGMRVLLINGIVENRTQDLLAMPAIRADLVSGEVVLASTLISTAASRIGGRESYGFSARVPHPGGKLPDLRLSLMERGA